MWWACRQFSWIINKNNLTIKGLRNVASSCYCVQRFCTAAVQIQQGLFKMHFHFFFVVFSEITRNNYCMQINILQSKFTHYYDKMCCFFIILENLFFQPHLHFGSCPAPHNPGPGLSGFKLMQTSAYLILGSTHQQRWNIGSGCLMTVAVPSFCINTKSICGELSVRPGACVCAKQFSRNSVPKSKSFTSFTNLGIKFQCFPTQLVIPMIGLD